MKASHLGQAIVGAAALAGVATASAEPVPSTTATTTYHRMQVDGVGIFYREAGPKDAPTIVLLHGYPSSSREFDTLIPLLATRYHLIAPDFPGFGQSEAPPPSRYSYTFDHLAETMDHLVDALKITSYTLYIHDYGAPVGTADDPGASGTVACPDLPERQSLRGGSGSEMGRDRPILGRPEGASRGRRRLRVVRRHRTTAHPRHVAPGTLRSGHLDRRVRAPVAARTAGHPGGAPLRLQDEHRRPIRKWQAWLREHKPPTLVVWGANDPSFIAAGATAFRHDLPDAEIHLLDAGHFALDEKTDEIAEPHPRVHGEASLIATAPRAATACGSKGRGRQPFAKAGHDEIDESAKLERQPVLFFVDKVDRPGRRLVGLEKGLQPLVPYVVRHLVRQGLARGRRRRARRRWRRRWC